jgi:hypothetical protein
MPQNICDVYTDLLGPGNNVLLFDRVFLEKVGHEAEYL